MTTRIASGKRKGLEAVADSRGVIAALAIDQRAAIRSLFAKTMAAEPASVPAEMLVTFKEAVSRILTPHASTILLDPEYGCQPLSTGRDPRGCRWPMALRFLWNMV